MTLAATPTIDPALPAMGVLLDADAMAPRLAAALHRGEAASVRVASVRYKPQRRLIVRYEIETDPSPCVAVAMLDAKGDLASSIRTPQVELLSSRVRTKCPARFPIEYDPALDAVIQWAPLDVEVPALAITSRELASILRTLDLSVPPTSAPEILAYKPFERVIVRFGTHVIKFYAQTHAWRDALAGLLTVQGGPLTIRTPALEGSLPAHKATVQAAVDGRVRLNPIPARPAGEIARSLHELPPAAITRRLRPQAQIERAAEGAEIVGALRPDLNDRLSSLLASLEETIPDVGVLVASHGDFDAGQLLSSLGQFFLLDLDEMCRAPAAFDLATFAAHVIGSGDRDLAAAEAVLDDLCAGYGRVPEELAWCLSAAILFRAPVPFRRFEPEWPERLEAMLTAAERTLAMSGDGFS